jgi:hypothetical protein
VVIDNFNILRIAAPPDKTYPELVVNPDAVLPNPIASQRFQPVARRRPQVIQSCRGMQISQFPAP